MKIIEDKVYMQYYWDLAAENISQRVKASYDLISYVKGIEELRNEKGNENKYQPLKDYLDYSLKRLIRGLGSPRDHARQGFAVTFSELIRAFHVDASTCIKLIDENLQVRHFLFWFNSGKFIPGSIGFWFCERIRRKRSYVWQTFWIC